MIMDLIKFLDKAMAAKYIEWNEENNGRMRMNTWLDNIFRYRFFNQWHIHFATLDKGVLVLNSGPHGHMVEVPRCWFLLGRFWIDQNTKKSMGR